MSAYAIPDERYAIKLDAMENPYSWPEAMVQAWLQRLQGVGVNRYPDPAARELTASLRQQLELPSAMGLILGNGSDELIQLLALTLGGAGRVVLAPEPGFVMYRMTAQFAAMAYVAVPLTTGFELDLDAMLAAIAHHQPALIYLAYPNNPTGNLFAEEEMEAILAAAPGWVVVDEAYHPFAGRSWVKRLGEFPNLLLLRTLSKMGLAGLRLGMLAGPQALVAEVNKVRLPYNINTLTQESALFALEHQAEFDRQTALIREQRQWLATALHQLPGVTPYPSAANFILLRMAPGQADMVAEGLKRAGTLIKNLSPVGGLLANCLRITVGTPEENSTLMTQLRALVQG
ncbi:MAG: histidinol-phosphate transaminase [Gammaproteobacteria bacterium]|nr:histidinol-phosphate transaminase [Gammaproteobacteria bacterium]